MASLNKFKEIDGYIFSTSNWMKLHSFLLATFLNQSLTVAVFSHWFILVLSIKILLILSSRVLLILPISDLDGLIKRNQDLLGQHSL